MAQDLQTISKYMTQRWKRSAEIAGIPEEGYRPKIKTVTDPSKDSSFKFGVILNAYRYERPQSPMPDCPLCDVVEEVSRVPERNLDHKKALPNYIVIPNLFPVALGVSMAIHKGTREEERKMFSTSDLGSLEKELEQIFGFTVANGFQAYHNSDGLGASIIRHEHWHFTNYGEIYTKAGEVYGFDTATLTDLSKVSQVQTMSDFPFANAVLNRSDTSGIVSLLKNMGESLGQNYDNWSVPQAVCQSIDGERILIVPAKTHDKGIGSGETAGHIVVKTQEDFDRADYQFCLNKLSPRLYSSSDLDMRKFL